MKKYLLMFMFPALIAFTGCSNDDGKTPEGPTLELPTQKLISKIVIQSSEETAIHTVEITYDENCRFSKVINTNYDGADTKENIEYNYSSDRVIVSSTYTNSEETGTCEEELTLNSEGFATDIAVWYKLDGEEYPHEENACKIEYKDGYISKASIYDDAEGGSPSYYTTSACTWNANGNMTGVTINYDWDEDGEYDSTIVQTAQYGNHLNNAAIDINQLIGDMYIEGVSGSSAMDIFGKRSKNLISKFEGDDYSVTYEYTFSNDLLIKVTATSNDGAVTTHEFTYQ